MKNVSPNIIGEFSLISKVAVHVIIGIILYAVIVIGEVTIHQIDHQASLLIDSEASEVLDYKDSAAYKLQLEEEFMRENKIAPEIYLLDESGNEVSPFDQEQESELKKFWNYVQCFVRTTIKSDDFGLHTCKTLAL